MPPPTLEDIVVLEMTIRGRVVLPKNAIEYRAQVEKMHNVGYHSRKPIMFVLCNDNDDVKQVLAFCMKHDMPISVRSGGHSACGSSLKDATVVIDLANIKHMSYVSLHMYCVCCVRLPEGATARSLPWLGRFENELLTNTPSCSYVTGRHDRSSHIWSRLQLVGSQCIVDAPW